MEIEALKCKCCGGSLNATRSVVVCDYCGVTNIICGDTGKYIDLLNKANKLRQHCDFDAAYDVYNEILEKNVPFADILWSQTLCEYGIEYVQDPISGQYIPTLHRIKDESILDCFTYREALELCDEEQKEKLIAAGEEIYKIQKDYLNIASQEKPYDVFICYKETDHGKRTEDSEIARELYDKLNGVGYKVFFSRITLQDKLSVDFEPYIFAAIKSAAAMVVFGSKKEFIDATWVKNEWSRFIRLKEKDPEKQIFFAVNNIEDLPRAYQGKQAQLLTEEGAIDNLFKNVRNYLTKVRKIEGEIVAGICPFCESTQRVNTATKFGLCTKCQKRFYVAEAIAMKHGRAAAIKAREEIEGAIGNRKKVKCPYCGKAQEPNIYGCIYCHKQFVPKDNWAEENG